MSRIKRIILIIMVILGLTSCDVLMQMSQIANFANCDFKFNSVSDIEMLGVKLSKGMSKDDLTIGQGLQLTKSLLNKSLPVTFYVNLDVTNPNSSPASMTKMDYSLTLNNKEVIATTLDQRINVPANASNTITIPVTTDLFQLFSGESSDGIVNLAFKLAGANSNPVNIGIKLKPYINVGNQQLAYPDYIVLNKLLQ